MNDLGLSLHEELDRREKLLKQLTEECDAIRKVLTLIERPTPEQLSRVTKVVGRRKTAKKSNGAAGPVCAKHPEAEFSPKGQCKSCKAEYMKRYWEKKKKAAEPPEPPKAMAAAATSVIDRTAKPRSLYAPETTGVQCLNCGDRFPTARELGAHRTAAHFGE